MSHVHRAYTILRLNRPGMIDLYTLTLPGQHPLIQSPSSTLKESYLNISLDILTFVFVKSSASRYLLLRLRVMTLLSEIM